MQSHIYYWYKVELLEYADLPAPALYSYEK